ncbi:MAG: hypothetical protein ACPGN3_17375, partial [Opitutales bacterium]
TRRREDAKLRSWAFVVWCSVDDWSLNAGCGPLGDRTLPLGATAWEDGWLGLVGGLTRRREDAKLRSWAFVVWCWEDGWPLFTGCGALADRTLPLGVRAWTHCRTIAATFSGKILVSIAGGRVLKDEG